MYFAQPLSPNKQKNQLLKIRSTFFLRRQENYKENSHKLFDETQKLESQQKNWVLLL